MLKKNVTDVDQMDRFGLVQFFFFNEKVEKHLRMCRKTFWYYGIDKFSFSRHNQYLVAETLSMKMLRDRPKLFGHRQVHIFVYQPTDRQLTTQADLSNVWGQKKDTITNCQTVPGRKLVQNSGCFFFNNFKGEKSNANNGKPTRNYTFYSEDRSILRAEATFSLCELSCEK